MLPRRFHRQLAAVAAAAYCLWLLFGSYSFADPIQVAKFVVGSLLFPATFAALAFVLVHPPTRWRSSFRRLRDERPLLLRFLLAGSAATGVMIASEATFFVLERARGTTPRVVSFDSSVYLPDTELGYRLKPGSSGRYTNTETSTGEVLYSVVYTIDDEGNRRVPSAADDGQRPEAFFFGCSFVFGEGVEDDETLPHYFSREAQGFRAVNCGLGGAGTNHVLAALQDGRLGSAERSDGTPIAFYVFIDGHAHRNVGSMRIANRFGARAPYYSIDASGELDRRGNFLEGRPLRSIVYWLLSKSATLRYWSFDWPLSIGTDDLELTARLIDEARNSFRAQTGSDLFVVVIYPGSLYAEPLTELLAARGVSFLDYSGLFERTDPRYIIKGDGHPNPLANRTLASKLAEDLPATTR